MEKLINIQGRFEHPLDFIWNKDICSKSEITRGHFHFAMQSIYLSKDDYFTTLPLPLNYGQGFRILQSTESNTKHFKKKHIKIKTIRIENPI